MQCYDRAPPDLWSQFCVDTALTACSRAKGGEYACCDPGGVASSSARVPTTFSVDGESDLAVSGTSAAVTVDRT
jgi:hypothetical protein